MLREVLAARGADAGKIPFLARECHSLWSSYLVEREVYVVVVELPSLIASRLPAVPFGLAGCPSWEPIRLASRANRRGREHATTHRCPCDARTRARTGGDLDGGRDVRREPAEPEKVRRSSHGDQQATRATITAGRWLLRLASV